MKFIYIKKELSPKIFNNQKNVKAIIRKKLIDLAYMYLRNNNLKDIKVLDIRMVGSLCNYNYNASSDLDLHITVDYSKISNNKDFVFEFCKTLRKNWSQNNRIKIYGFPVEIFIEDKNVPMNDKGIYSLLKNKWLNEPKKVSREKINLDDIKSLYIKYKRTIRDLLKSDDINEYNKFSDELASFRKKGLSSEKGEYSDENIIFKLLRKYKKLDLVTNRKNNLLRRRYTLKESVDLLKEDDNELNDISEINDKNKIDIYSLNNFLLEKGDDNLDVLLQVSGYKNIEGGYESEFFFKKILPDEKFNKALIPIELWNNYSFCEKAVSSNGNSLFFVASDLIDYNLCEKAVSQNGYALSHVPEKFKDYNLYEKAVIQNGEALRRVPENLRDYNLCEKAVSSNGNALEYVPEEIIDYNLCEKAVSSNGYALALVPYYIRDINIVKKAYKKDKNIITTNWFPKSYIEDYHQEFIN